MLDARVIAPPVEEPVTEDPESPVNPANDVAANRAPFAPSVESGGCSSTSSNGAVPFAFSVLALFGMRRVVVRGTLRRRPSAVRAVRTHFARIAMMLALALTGATTACVQEVEDGADGSEPIDERDNEIFQGIYDCSESNSTGYRSGSSFSIKVVTVDGRPVELKTANAYIAMQSKAKQAGINIRIVSGFRTNAQQQYLYSCYINCNCNNCNLAARPGYSNHQSGHALDLNTKGAGVLSWLNNNASKYGFKRTVPSEPWHWEYWGGMVDGGCGGATAKPAPSAGCNSDTLGRVVPLNTCVQSKFDRKWYQCLPGNDWEIRWNVPAACVSEHPL